MQHIPDNGAEVFNVEFNIAGDVRASVSRRVLEERTC